MPTQRQQDTLVLRGAYISAYHQFKLSWNEIATLFQVNPSTARGTYIRACARAQSTELLEILKHLEDQPRPGRKQHFPQGSEISIAMAEFSQMDQDHQDAPHRRITAEVAYQFNVDISENTGEKILQSHHGIRKLAPPEKPELTATHKATRVELAKWALPQLWQGDIFVFSDECSVDGLFHTKKPRVSVPAGTNTLDYKRPQRPTTQSTMFWGAIALGYGSGPYHIWQEETEAEKKDIQRELQEEVQYRKDLEVQQQRRATQPGTVEYSQLAEINHNIAIQRVQRPRLRFKRPEQLFQQPKPTRQGTKGGIDWIRYKREILLPKLYPFAIKIHQETGKRVWIVEDNAPSHKKAKLFTAELRKEASINTVNWPPQSPDLNKIEPLWAKLKDQLQQFAIEQDIRSIARPQLQAHWIRNWKSLPNELTDSLCLDFRNKLEQVLKNNGDNNFHG